jgi:hypothetical protein
VQTWTLVRLVAIACCSVVYADATTVLSVSATAASNCSATGSTSVSCNATDPGGYGYADASVNLLQTGPSSYSITGQVEAFSTLPIGSYGSPVPAGTIDPSATLSVSLDLPFSSGNWIVSGTGGFQSPNNWFPTRPIFIYADGQLAGELGTDSPTFYPSESGSFTIQHTPGTSLVLSWTGNALANSWIQPGGSAEYFNINLTDPPAPVPEPASVALLLFGLIVTVALISKKRFSSQL